MSDVANGLNLHLGRGSLYIDRLDPTTLASTGKFFAGECPAFAVTTAEDEVRAYDHTLPTTPLLARDVIRRTPTFNFTLKEFTKQNVGLGVMGSVNELTQTGGAITGEILSTAPLDDRFYQTTKRVISAATVKRGSTTLTLGTDYKISDAESGLIYIIAGATAFLAATGNLTIDYTAAALVTGSGRTWIKGGDSSIFAALKYIENPTRGPKHEIDVWKAIVSPDGDVGWITDDYGEIKLKAEVLSDSANHPTCPLYQVLVRP